MMVEVKSTLRQEDIDQIAAECKFLRGLAYFDLARLFCQPIAQGSGASQLGVPVVLTYELGQPARNTLGEVFVVFTAGIVKVTQRGKVKFVLCHQVHATNFGKKMG